MFDTANIWYYAVVTWDGSDMATYVNGEATTEGVYNSFDCEVYTGCLVFGQDQDSLGGGFEADSVGGMEQKKAN